ncbi:MAG TPA: peptide chain release factor N(5)-glutamine methyltransferase [Allosphingosinicella sp.]|jgi:release factor glutamine methyltransferase|uniref:peptide chain release factor N(5)-glutamine methyltransferase n=1 Tax=Allosphingosinicella sp. TaxID=2823234 RepID=UPI002F29FB71
MKVREALAEATRRLGHTSDTPRLDAELLMAHALRVTREAMLLHHLDAPAPPPFEALLPRRESGEPVAYITGRRSFWTIELEVGPGVLVPRPDSETLIEAALAHFGEHGPATIVDLGTGPGTLLLAAMDQWPRARGLGIDGSDAALAYARANAERLGLASRAHFAAGNWAEGLDERFDLILCNPPYVEAGAELSRDVMDWEPHSALFAGPDGLDDYRRLAREIPRLINPGGLACLEIGAGQEGAVAALFRDSGLHLQPHRDLAGHVRCLALAH